MTRNELKDAIVSAIIDENGALTTEELTQRIFGVKSNAKQMEIARIAKNSLCTFTYLGRGIGWTLTDQKWDEIEKERRKSERR